MISSATAAPKIMAPSLLFIRFISLSTWTVILTEVALKTSPINNAVSQEKPNTNAHKSAALPVGTITPSIAIVTDVFQYFISICKFPSNPAINIRMITPSSEK